MSRDQMGRGSTLLFPSTHHNPDKLHLCIILNDPPAKDPRQVLYVPVITALKKSDMTCTLNVGDHDFIKVKSIAHYARAGVRTVEHMLKCGELKEPLESAVLKRVFNGVFDSPHSAPWVRSFLEEHMLDEDLES